MKFSNFEYDGVTLESMGLQIVSFSGMQDDDITTDSQRTFNSISLFNGEYQPFITSVFEDRLEIEFSIAKQYCTKDSAFLDDSGFFTVQEIEAIQYWLNRPTSHIFKILDEPEYADVYWEGSFNLQWIKVGEDTVGFNATFISNRPYAIGNEVLYEKDLQPNEELTLADFSYDEGSIVPDIILEIKQDGDLEFTTTFNDKSTVTKIKNCTSGEVITFSKMMQITSSNSSHAIYDDFNWIFPRIYNLYGNIINTYKSNLECNCKIYYNPVRKVTFS